MWWKNPTPMTDEERESEIHRLEGVRDKLLDAAPMHFYFRRLLLPIMLALVVVVIWHAVWTRPSNLTFGAAIFFAAFLLVLGHSTWKVWKGTPTDKWSFSDGLGYEGDSPRDVQQKIDALRASLTTDAKQN
jgi:hypothetical protein